MDVVLVLTVNQRHGIVVGLNDGKGCFHFMSGIGDKLLLLFHTHKYRANDLARKQNNNNKQNHPAQHRYC